MATFDLDAIYDGLLDDKRMADLGFGGTLSNRDCRKTTIADRRRQRRLDAGAAHLKRLRETIDTFVTSNNVGASHRRLEKDMAIAVHEENLSGRDLMGVIGQQFARHDYCSRGR